MRFLHYITLFVFEVLLLITGIKTSGAAQSQHQPNILWIVANDLSVDLGAYGNKDVHTPNLDQLAREGVLYDNFITVGAVCSPSRSAFITGMYATSINSHNQFARNKKPLPDNVVPVTEYFRKAGYFVTNGQGPVIKTGFYTGYNFLHNGKELYDSSDWKNRREGQPFFAQVHLSNAHRPFSQDPSRPIPAETVNMPPYLPDHPVARKDWALYLETVQLLDKQIGQILDRLREEGLLENTVVFFFSDHGRPHIRDKQFLYDGGVHAPLIVRWPGKRSAGTREDRLVSNIDLAPASMKIAGIEVPAYMEGRDFISQGSIPRDYVLSMRDRCDGTIDRIRAVRTKEFKYIRNFFPEKPYTQFNAYKKWAYPALTVMQVMHKQGKLTPVQSAFMADTRPAEELYDLEKDPFELNNLAASPAHRSKLGELRLILDQWLAAGGDRGEYPEDPAEVEYATELMWQQYRKNMTDMGVDPEISDEDLLRYWEGKLLSGR